MTIDKQHYYSHMLTAPFGIGTGPQVGLWSGFECTAVSYMYILSVPDYLQQELSRKCIFMFIFLTIG